MPDLIIGKKKQKRLIITLIFTLIITFFVLWYGFLRPKNLFPDVQPEQSSEPAFPGFEQPVEIDMELLKSPTLKDLRFFEEIKQFDGQAGRQNPFTPPF